jgi:phosphate/sulfate permease
MTGGTNMIDWKKKLTSRKFWMAVVAFITPLLLAFGIAENDVTQIVAIIMAGADVVAYIIAEGLVDAGSK